ncbi:MAG TPA: S1/P1 nuclease, partial [Flavobacteriaceae bacterium]|nr:S1/P1 nuclease [Flavobacteriaceae bacterium]
QVFYLKLLVHFIGDMHQPMHAGRKADKGGNTIQVRWFNSGTNLHSVWDSKMLNHFDMSYTELAENLDVLSKKQVKFLQEGDIITWINETSGMAKKVYNSVEVGEKLGYNYMYNYFDVAELQLQKGGVRLAKVLNQLFG